MSSSRAASENVRAPSASAAARSKSSPSSASDNGCSTYTAARESSALFTSNDGILGRRADERDQPLLDERQKRILLRLVEAVHFVDEENRVPAGLLQIELGAIHRFAYVLDAREHRRERDEFRVERLRHQPRERRLADAGRAPQDHRMRFARFEREPQRLARAEQMALAYDFVERRAAAAARRAALRAPALRKDHSLRRPRT